MVIKKIGNGFVILSLSLFFLLSIQSAGKIVWKNREATIVPAMTNEIAIGYFYFSNAGPNTIKIEKIVSCCDCTVTEIATNIYQIGESGTIMASLKIANRKGDQEKRILVTINDTNTPVTELKFKVHIPEILTMSAGYIYWIADEKPVEKTIRLWTTNVPDVVVTGVDTTHEQLWPILRTIVPGKEYELRVKPTDTKIPAQATFKIQTSIGNDFQKSFMAYGEIKKVSTTASVKK